MTHSSYNCLIYHDLDVEYLRFTTFREIFMLSIMKNCFFIIYSYKNDRKKKKFTNRQNRQPYKMFSIVNFCLVKVLYTWKIHDASESVRIIMYCRDLHIHNHQRNITCSLSTKYSQAKKKTLRNGNFLH